MVERPWRFKSSRQHQFGKEIGMNMNVIAGLCFVAFLALLFAIVLLVRKDGTVLSQIAKQASSVGNDFGSHQWSF